MDDLFASALFAAMYKARSAYTELGIVRAQSKPSRAVFALRTWAAGDAIAMHGTNARSLTLQEGESDTDTATPFIAIVDGGAGVKNSFLIGADAL